MTVSERVGSLMETLGTTIFGWGMRLKTPEPKIPVPMMNATQIRDHLNSMDIDSDGR